MQVKRIFFVAALTAAVTCRVPARGADSNGTELDCHGQGQAKLHALVHIDNAPTKRIVLKLDSPAADFLSGFNVEDGRTSLRDDGWEVAENVSISDEKITWKKEATCRDPASQKCTTGSKRVQQEGSVNRYTGQLTDKSTLGPTLELGCEVLQQKF
jgi:hypothetical protein